MRVGIWSHNDCVAHDMGAGHPERPARRAAVNDGLIEAGLADWLDWHEAPSVTREALLRGHPSDYLDDLAARAPATGSTPLDADTILTPHTLAAASRAAGAGCAAVDAVVGGDTDAAFANVRPPGHHAERRRAMGFCFYNNIAATALHALHEHALERVAICDFDVHHGNGTEDIFEGDPRVLFCSTFQFPLFPGYYGRDIPGQRVNCPLDAGTGGDGFRDAIGRQWLPALEAFQPQLVLVSAGFDAHADDPIGGLRLTTDDFHWVTERIGEIADRFAGGRIVALLEGGYDLAALGASAAAHVRALLGQPGDGAR
jgi:acetoin utilization deacetylase AcuC-like enzyme